MMAVNVICSPCPVGLMKAVSTIFGYLNWNSWQNLHQRKVSHRGAIGVYFCSAMTIGVASACFYIQSINTPAQTVCRNFKVCHFKINFSVALKRFWPYMVAVEE